MLSVSLLSLAGACALMSARLGLGEHHGAIWSLRCSETACSWMSKHKALTSTHLYCGAAGHSTAAKRLIQRWAVLYTGDPPVRFWARAFWYFQEGREHPGCSVVAQRAGGLTAMSEV